MPNKIQMFTPVSICPQGRKVFAGHSVRLNRLSVSTVGKPPCLPALLSVSYLLQCCGKLQMLQTPAPWCKAELFIFSQFSTGISSGGAYLLRFRFEGCCTVVSAYFSHSWMHFRGGVHQCFEQHSTPQIATLKVKGHLCWVRCYFQGDRHIYTLAQPILFWILYK